MTKNHLDKYLFIEFKYGLVDPHPIIKSGANKLMVAASSKDPDFEFLNTVEKAGLSVGLCTNAYQGECLADPASLEELKSRVEHLVKQNPNEIWLDYLRFKSRCIVKGEEPIDTHKPCKFCKNIKREDIVTDYYGQVRKLIPNSIKFGLFAVAFIDEDYPVYKLKTGLNYSRIKEHVDIISPMLYHRMMDKPINYIGKYVAYLREIGYKEIIPIIQVKDMPDELPDNYTEDEIKQAYEEAVRPPSSGVAFFSWDHAVEEGKTEIIKKLFENQ